MQPSESRPQPDQRKGVLRRAAAPPFRIPAGARLEIELAHTVRLHRVGQAVTAELASPLYAENCLVLPAGTPVRGEVTAVHGPRWWKRADAAFGGDFSPAPAVSVRFDTVQLPGGGWVPMATRPAPELPPLHMVAAAPPSSRTTRLERRVSQLYHQQEDDAESFLDQQRHWATLKTELVQSLPYRPTLLPAGTRYAATLTAALQVDANRPTPPAAPLPPALPAGLTLQARLETGLSSQSSRWGAPVRALLVAPVFDAAGSVLIPQGTELLGKVVQVRPARWWGRSGQLRFLFSQLRLPSGATRQPAMRLAAAATSEPMTLDGEGAARVAPAGGASPYLALGVLTATVVTGGDADNAWSLNAGSGTRLRLWGAAVAVLMARARPLALGFGFVGAGRTVWRRWVGRGPAVAFPAGTPLVIATAPAAAHGRPLAGPHR